MRTLLLSALACVIGILPLAAHAEDKLLMVDLPDLPRSKPIIGGDAAVIGAGVVVGAAAGYSLLPFPAATLVGGVAGGLVLHWWYNRELDNYQPLPRRNPQ